MLIVCLYGNEPSNYIKAEDYLIFLEAICFSKKLLVHGGGTIYSTNILYFHITIQYP
jgi:hypothetical protein